MYSALNSYFIYIGYWTLVIYIYIYMALSTMNTQKTGYCEIDLKRNRRDYKNVRLSLLKDLCSDVILSHYDFQKEHQHLKFNLGGKPGQVIPYPSEVTCAVS